MPRPESATDATATLPSLSDTVCSQSVDYADASALPIKPKCNCNGTPFRPQPLTGVELTRRCIGFVYNARTGGNDPVTRFTWRTSNFMTASVMTYGATVLSIAVPSKYAATDDVVLGFDTLDEYVQHSAYHFGAVLGRCANIVADAEYETHRCAPVVLSTNANSRHHINGGFSGLDRVNWAAHTTGTQLILSYVSPGNEGGYPGALMCQIRFAVTMDNQLHIAYMAQAERRTPVNLSHRVYMNLAGHAAGRAALAEHVFNVNARKVVEYDAEHLVPTGRSERVGDRPDVDCRVAIGMGAQVRQSPLGHFRETFIVHTGPTPTQKRTTPVRRPRATDRPTKHFVTRVVHPASGRVLEVYSSQRCVEFSTCHQLPNVPLPTPAPPEPIEVSDTQQMCTDIISDIVAEISDVGRYVKRNILRDLIDRACNIRMAMDGTVPTTVMREMLDEICAEVRRMREAEEAEAEEEQEEEELDERPTPVRGKEDAEYMQNGGFYAQMQNFPDAVHHRGRYGDILLEPGQTYRHEVTYKFGLHMGGVMPARLYLSQLDSEFGSQGSSSSTNSSTEVLESGIVKPTTR